MGISDEEFYAIFQNKLGPTEDFNSLEGITGIKKAEKVLIGDEGLWVWYPKED